MTYPEPIPAIKKKDCRKFDENLRNFSLSTEQVRMYAAAKKKFKG